MLNSSIFRQPSRRDFVLHEFSFVIRRAHAVGSLIPLSALSIVEIEPFTKLQKVSYNGLYLDYRT